MNYKLRQGDNIELLKKMTDNSVDAIVTDPPYGLSFMNKKWDYDVPSVELWREVYRVLKPGGHVLSFGGTRTYHRMVVNMEDAGFEIRDQIMWLYGSGFPKSHNISKAIDKVEGNERKVIGRKIQRVDGTLRNVGSTGAPFLIDSVEGSISKPTDGYIDIEEPGSENSKRYNGWGTALKPANEPICVARKPLSEKSVAQNVLKWGTGGINIDGCRVGTDTIKTNMMNTKGGLYNLGNENRTNNKPEDIEHEGRFPANIILECICDEVIKGEKGDVKSNTREAGNSFNNYDDKKGKVVTRIENYNDKGDIHTNPMCPCRLMDEQSGLSKSRTKYPEPSLDGLPMNHYETTKIKHQSGKEQTKEFISDKGGASRYFQQIKGGGTEDFFIYKENNIIIWNIKSLDTQELEMVEYGEASDALKQARENICQKPELYGNNTSVKYLMNTISITKMKTHSIMTLTILNAYTKTNIGHFTLMIDENQSQLLTEESILNVQIVSNQNALVSSIKTSQEVLVPIVNYVLEENFVSGETTIESAITNTIESIGASRFVYQSKVSKKERNMGLDGFEEVESKTQFVQDSDKGKNMAAKYQALRPARANTHPTVKPVQLMAYLCRLITPPGGIVLDPFMGSGSTGIAALLEGFNFIGFDLDPDYVKIAEARIANYEKYREFKK